MNMVEETSVINDAPKKSNTCGLLALIFALIGVVLTISLIGAPIGIIFLIVAGILGLIGLFKAPRGKAWAGIVISLISLFAIGYAVQWMVNIAFEPIKEFVVWIDEEAKTDTELRLVFKQPGFENFLESRLKERIYATNLSTLPQTGSPKMLVSFYLHFFLEELKAEIPLAVHAWIERYGVPNAGDDLIGVEQYIPNQEEWRMDDDVELESGMSREDLEVLIDFESENPELSSGELEQLLETLEE